jgi:hypothetical protein
MAIFLDTRLQSVGGGLAASVSLMSGTSLNDYASVTRDEVLAAVRGRNVMIGTHGFSVDRAAGIDCLVNWGTLFELNLTDQDVFLGLLWPGDSVWAHGLDYAEEPKVADHAGDLVGPFLDDLLADAVTVSLASHSLGARVLLQTVLRMTTHPRLAVIMAGAIDDNCLNKEFKDAAAKVGEISVLASKKDAVLEFAFPLGNFFAGIIDQGHPWWRGALGRSGPAKPRPANVLPPYEIPSGWDYGHHHYLQVDPGAAGALMAQVNVPPEGTPMPENGSPGWQQVFSSGFAATRFKG